MRWAIVIEGREGNYGAYVPDLSGCVTTGDTLDEVREMMREAIAFHLDGMREDGDPIPDRNTRVAYVEVTAQPHP